MVNTGESYGVNETKHSVSETTSSLVIRSVSRHKHQMGRYQCVAKNSLGKDVKSVNIYRESHNWNKKTQTLGKSCLML